MKAKMSCTRNGCRCVGASTTEFIIVAPVLLLLGLGAIQMALIYNGKATLNYATFEAARAGAVSNAQIAPMRNELGLRLSSLIGGDGSAEKAAEAIVLSRAMTVDPTRTTVGIINPTREAFEDWGVDSPDTDNPVIPNSHLRHKNAEEVGTASGLNLHDANLLKISVTHGMELKIPIIREVLTTSMAVIDPSNADYYARSLFPLSSVATVRMQSDAWQSDAIQSASTTPGGEETGEFIPDEAVALDTVLGNSSDDDCSTPHGLPNDLPLISAEDFASGVCTAADFSYGEPSGGGSEDTNNLKGCAG